MDEEEFREGLNAAGRENSLFWVGNHLGAGVAVGLDSGRGVAILHSGAELPLASLRAIGPHEPMPETFL